MPAMLLMKLTLISCFVCAREERKRDSANPERDLALVFMPVSSLSLSYESSSEDEDCAPPQKRRKLPALSSTLTVQKPVDDPALHQGRTRSSPFVEGQWAAYVYVPVRLDSESSFDRVLAAAVRAAQLQVPTLHPLGIRQGRKNAVELHISLSRPIYLRAHQRADLEHAVQALAEKACPCVIALLNVR
jgi:hypothetical protein